jgi:AraC-like DNA-binding protein
VGTRGRVRVDALTMEAGWSRTRLWSRFRSEPGLSPKRAARLVRFDHAAHQLAAGRPAAQVAAEGGSADPSHLHRDVMSFTGATPTAGAGAPWLAVDESGAMRTHDPIAIARNLAAFDFLELAPFNGDAFCMFYGDQLDGRRRPGRLAGCAGAPGCRAGRRPTRCRVVVRMRPG